MANGISMADFPSETKLTALRKSYNLYRLCMYLNHHVLFVESRMSSHLIQQFRPLVDLSLYCSAENYQDSTRPAFSAGASFPESWIIPSGRYSIAEQRVQHLGLNTSNLTLPPAPEPQASDSAPSQVFDEPSPDQNGRGKTPNSADPKIATQLAARKRLSSLVEIALDPLMALLSKRSDLYLFGEYPSLVDCHLLALASLALVPKLPAPFLADAIRKQFEDRLDVYVSEGIKNAYGRAVTPEDALVKAPIASDDDDEATFEAYENMDIGSGEVELPWRRPKPRSIGDAIGGALRRAYGAGEAVVVGA